MVGVVRNYRFYTNSEDAWAAMLRAMENAKKFIYWESYILLNDTPRYNFFELLERKARQGISVKVIVDGFGSLWLGSKARREIAASGGEILSFNRRWPLPRTHRKILVVDGAVGFIGGVNVARRMMHWDDLQIKLTSRPLLRHFVRSFARAYAKAGGRDSAVLAHDRVPPKVRRVSERAKVWFLEHWPVKGRSLLKKYYRERIREAKRSIVVVTPYFIPHHWLRRELIAAAGRGVTVEIILPNVADHTIGNFANRIFSSLNQRSGIQFYFTPHMMHAKALLIDNREGLVGSNNIDAQSFDYNIESSVVFKRKDMVGDFRIILDSWKRKAEPFRSEIHLAWYHRLFAPLFRLIQPVL